MVYAKTYGGKAHTQTKKDRGKTIPFLWLKFGLFKYLGEDLTGLGKWIAQPAAPTCHPIARLRSKVTFFPTRSDGLLFTLSVSLFSYKRDTEGELTKTKARRVGKRRLFPCLSFLIYKRDTERELRKKRDQSSKASSTCF